MILYNILWDRLLNGLECEHKMKYIENDSNDIYFNLALEEYIFNNFKDDTYLLLWRNDNSIVLGKHQNIFEEVNLRATERMGINVARRSTGGGAVFHDKGNLNYSFISYHDSNPSIEYDKFLNPVISALKSLGVQAEKRRTCDIAIDGKKISGSAQTIKGGRILHHGTLLFDTDLSKLNEVLKAPEGEINSKAVKSVKSTVTNIKEYVANKVMTIDDFQNLLLKALFPEGVKEDILSKEQLQEIKELAENKYSKWQWNYGKSPKFSFQKESIIFGEKVYIKLYIDKGIIVSSEIIWDKLPVKDIELAIIETPYSYKEIGNRLKEIKSIENIKNLNIEELTSCFF